MLTPAAPARVVVDGVAFEHGFNEQFEYYAHTDERRWCWQIWRHLHGPIDTTVWFASADKPGPYGAVKMLNSKTELAEGDQVGPLYELNARDPTALLRGLTSLIRQGEWPQDRRVRRDEAVQYSLATPPQHCTGEQLALF